MTDRNSNVPFRIHKRSIIAIAAGVLIGLGLVLQWAEVSLSRFLSQNMWFFGTVLSASWNIIKLSAGAGAWSQYMHHWPLLLVIVGSAMLFSLCPKCANRAAGPK
jgi:hypothetical protein